MDPAEVRHVRIVNNNVFPLDDHFNGRHYVFPSGVAVTVPLAVAEHCFGFSLTGTEEDAMAFSIKRRGWNRPEVVADGDHVRFFRNLQIRPAFFKMVEVDPDEDDDVDDDAPEQKLEAPKPVRRGRPPGRPPKRKMGRPPSAARVLTPAGEPIPIIEPSREPLGDPAAE